MFENIDLSAILEEKTHELVKGLLNFIEQLSSKLRELQAENQRLRDAVNRLKGPSARQAGYPSECESESAEETLIGKGAASSAPTSWKKEDCEPYD